MQTISELTESTVTRLNPVTPTTAAMETVERTHVPYEPCGWHGRHILDLASMCASDILTVMAESERMYAIRFGQPTRTTSRPDPALARRSRTALLPDLSGLTVVTLFFEPSTRTRASFEIAVRALRADFVEVSVATSSVKKGESLLDTALNLEAMGIDAVVVRHSVSGAAHFLSENLDAVVFNAGDGMHEHPTQGLLDLFTALAYLGISPAEYRGERTLAGLRLTILGDVTHSRVARSDIYAFTKLGAEVTLCGPRTLVPPELATLPGVRWTESLDEALRGADVVQVLRLQLERQAGNLFPSASAYRREWGLTGERLAHWLSDKQEILSLRAGSTARTTAAWHCGTPLVMHPGPMNRGVEIDSDVADGPQARILEQVGRGVAVRMALLNLTLGEEYA